MTREEELNEAWCKYMGKCSTEIMQALAFALRWADEHPKLVVIPPEEIENVAKYVIDKDWQAQKDKLWVMIERNLRAKFIDKACDWLALQAQYVNIDGFRKAMKSGSSEIPNNSKKGGEE